MASAYCGPSGPEQYLGPHQAYPVFIPSKGRAGISATAKLFDHLGIRFRMVVEPDEVDAYASAYGIDRLLVLDPDYQRTYDTCDDIGPDIPVGSGAARNFAWDVAKSEGHSWQWTIDDNIDHIRYLDHRTRLCEPQTGLWMRRLEYSVTRWSNVDMAGPHALNFIRMDIAHGRTRRIVSCTRIYSFNLIRCASPFRWRGRYNEDTILSLDMLTAGRATALDKIFLMHKQISRSVPGGNTAVLYAKGTGPKSRTLKRTYPQYVDLVHKFGRVHHQISYRKHFGHLRLLPDPEHPHWSQDART